jgi:hypothetical protein
MRAKDVPMNLSHKPVVACDYQELNKRLGNFDSLDSKFLSVGRAQWDQNDLSVKVFRKGNSGRWSAQSEEVPVWRLPYMFAMLLETMLMIQSSGEKIQGGVGAEVVVPEDIDFLRSAIKQYATPLQEGLPRVKELLDKIDLGKLGSL